MSETTIRKWYTDFTEATGEPITHVKIYGERWEFKYRSGYDQATYSPDTGEGIKNWAVAPLNTVFTFEDTPVEILDFPFDDGFGSAEAPMVIAWSESFVIYFEEYDGSQNIAWLPKSPTKETSDD